jgi:sulfite reductase (ferredoxin)
VRLHFSGCSNSCGQHGLAHIGFFGKAGRKDNRAYPAYTVVAGANIDGNSGSTLAQKVADIPARAVPRFLTEFLSHCAERKSRYSSFLSYLEKEGLDAARAISEKNQHVPAFAEDQSWYRDWNSQSLFSLEGRGKGECAAGLFDLIEVDLEKAAAARRELSRVSDDRGTDTLLHEILLTSARALLITQTGDRAADANVPELFDRFLVQPGFVSPDSLRVVHLLRTHHRDQLLPHKAAILSFADTIETLYASLDEKLQFQQSSERTEKDQAKSVADLEKDFRGVACPMNFVKTKMALSQLEAGQVLRVLLDDGAPIENVPASAQSEGHGIVARENRGNYWALDIRKAK